MYFVPLSPVRHFEHTGGTVLPRQGVGISLKMWGVVNGNSEGGQIPTVYHGRAEVLLEMKSMSEVWCHILILFPIFIIKMSASLLLCFTSDFPKTKTKEFENKQGGKINLTKPRSTKQIICLYVSEVQRRVQFIPVKEC